MKKQNLLFIIILFIFNNSFSQEDILRIQYFKLDNEYILEVIKAKDESIKIESKSKEYIEFSTGIFNDLIERYNLNVCCMPVIT